MDIKADDEVEVRERRGERVELVGEPEVGEVHEEERRAWRVLSVGHVTDQSAASEPMLSQAHSQMIISQSYSLAAFEALM